MSDMVKRVGRAIWLKLGSAELDECEEAARAAIEAMRIPRNYGLVQDITDYVFNEKIDEALSRTKTASLPDR